MESVGRDNVSNSSIVTVIVITLRRLTNWGNWPKERKLMRKKLLNLILLFQ